MNSFRVLLVVLAAAVASSSEGLAQQTVFGGGPQPINATGIAQGVFIDNSGGLTTLTVGAIAGPNTNVFTNNAAGPFFPATAISTNAASQGTAQFNSSSTVFGAIGTSGTFLLNVNGGNNGTQVNFLGPVFATTTTVSGTGTLNFASGNTNVTAPAFAGDGIILLQPNTTIIGALTTAAGANTGTLQLNANSVLNGAVGGAVGLKNIAVLGGSNTAGVSASISGATQAQSFTLGTNTLNIGGALTLNPGGVINTTLASASVFGNIRPVGATNLPASLLVNVTVPSSAVLPVGTIFNIVQTAAGTVQSGTNGSIVNISVQSPTNPLYTFEAVPLAGTVAGLVAIRVTGVPALVPINPPPGPPLPPVIVPIAVPIAVTLVNANLPVLSAVNALSDPSGVVYALAQFAPSAPALAAPYVAFEGSRQFQNLWLARLDQTLCGQVRQPRPDEQANCPQPESGWWLKGFGYLGTQGAQTGFVGYNSAMGGAMIAYDRFVDPATRVGFGVGYSRTSILGQTFDARADFNTYRATLYAAHEPGPWFVYGEASFGYNTYTGARHIVFPGFNQTAQSSYNGQEYTASLMAGYHFFVQGVTITPLASLQYTHMNLDGYTEFGAPDANLNVRSQSYDFLQSGLGATVAHPFALDQGALVPEFHAKWLYMLANPTLQNTATFAAGSAPFTTPGLATYPSMFNAGAGLTFLSCSCAAKTWSLEAVYDFYARSDNYFAHAGMLRFTGRF